MNFSQAELNKFKKLGKVYLQAKALILYAEEIDPNSNSNLQVIKELRDAFDHLMQVFIDKEKRLRGKSHTDENFAEGNIEKAIAHVYRAAFDALDGSVLSLKVMIAEVLNKYPIEVIQEVNRDYWEIKKKIIRISEQVGIHRGQKDISANIDIVFDNYVKDVENLKIIYDDFLNYGTAFDECLKHYKEESSATFLKKYATEFMIGLLVALISFFLGLYYFRTDSVIKSQHASPRVHEKTPISDTTSSDTLIGPK